MSEFHEITAEYMNVPPTELAQRLRTERDPAKIRAMRRALEVWRLTEGNPLARSAQRVARSWLRSFVSL